MEQILFDQNGGTYTQQGDYMLPDVKLPEQRAQNMFDRLVDELSEKEGVTEKLKAENPMLWVQWTNNIRNRVMEIVNSELIYT